MRLRSYGFTARFASSLLLSVLVGVASCGGAGTASSSPGGTAAAPCGEVGYGVFPGVRSGDKPSLPKTIEDREVAAGHRQLKLGVHVCVGPAGNIISSEVKEPSQSIDLDAHVKQTVDTWSFCPFTPDRQEKEPRCDTLHFQFEIKAAPTSAPTSAPASAPAPKTP